MKNKEVENNLEQNTEKKKVKKIGQITFGFTLILLGISVFVQSLVSFEVLRYVLMMWPLIFISLGIEIINYSKKDNINIKYDILGVILIFIILGCTTVFSVINYGVNKLLYNEDVSNMVVDDMIDNANTYELYNKVKIVNIGEKKINVKVIEDKDYDCTKVYITGVLNDMYLNGKAIKVLVSNNYSIHNLVDIERASIKNTNSEDEYNFVTIDSLPKWYDSININIVTNDKSGIEIKGEHNLI